MHHKWWTQPPRACALYQEMPPQVAACTPQLESSPCFCCNGRKPVYSHDDPVQPKINKYFKNASKKRQPWLSLFSSNWGSWVVAWRFCGISDHPPYHRNWNVSMIWSIKRDSKKKRWPKTPKYFFSSHPTSVGLYYATSVIPKMLVHFLAKRKPFASLVVFYNSTFILPQ